MHFERDGSGQLIPQPGDEGDEGGEDVSVKRSTSTELNLQVLIETQQRNMDQWCFAEHMDPAVLFQVSTTNCDCDHAHFSFFF